MTLTGIGKGVNQKGYNKLFSLTPFADFESIGIRMENTTIECKPNGPLMVRNVKKIIDSDGQELAPKQERVLCRCGQTKYKPFCDGSHIAARFDDGNRSEDKGKSDVYIGDEVTIYFNKRLCNDCEECYTKFPSVFGSQGQIDIHPEVEDMEKIIGVIQNCPSGALSYTADDLAIIDPAREPAIFIIKNGPYQVQGSIELLDVEKGDRASDEHYVLCRCGGSANKPFCDGTHKNNGFRDDQWFKIANMEDITKELTRVSIGKRELVIVKRGDVLSVFSGACLHGEALLSEGFIEDDYLTCGKHLWQYNINTGQLVGDPSMHLKKLKIKIEQKELLIDRDELNEVEEIET